MGSTRDDLRTELAMAKQTRTCPPLRIMNDPAHREAVAAHKRICPACSGGRDAELADWGELAAGLAGAAAAGRASAEDPPPASGEIRPIRADLGRWKDGFYYTPPAVLLLEPIPGLEGAFRAAQIHFDPELAAPGDLVLEHERTGAGDLMVECWNTYPVTSDRLGPAIGNLAPETLAAVRGMVREPAALPSWAVQPRPMREHDPRVYFREIEVEVQYLFASAVVADLIGRLEARAVRSSAAEVIDFLARRFGPERVPQGWTRPEEILAAFEPPLNELPLAAAAPSAKRRITANRVRLAQGRVKEVRPIAAFIVQEGGTETGRFAAVEIAEPVAPDADSWLFCLLFRPGKSAEAAERIDWDPQARRFVADFAVPFDGPAELRVALFIDQRGPVG